LENRGEIFAHRSVPLARRAGNGAMDVALSPVAVACWRDSEQAWRPSSEVHSFPSNLRAVYFPQLFAQINAAIGADFMLSINACGRDTLRHVDYCAN
jgi:hypothetical protein